MTLAAYREKMRELPLVSVFCSCILPEPKKKPEEKTQGVVDLNLSLIRDMEVIELNKRTSGQAFEVILRPPSFDGTRDFHTSFPPRRDTSLEEIQKKLDAAEERRKSQEAGRVRQLAERREREGGQKVPEEQRDPGRRAGEVQGRSLDTARGHIKAQGLGLQERLQEKKKHAQEVP